MKRGVAWAGAAVLALGITTVVAPAPTAIGDSSRGSNTRSVAQLEAAAARHPSQPHAPLPLRRAPARTANPSAVPTTAPAPATSTPRIALTTQQTFDGPGLEGNIFPPDTQGDIGPAQFVVTLNTRFRSYTRAGVADGVLNLLPDDFFAGAMTTASCNFTSDPHIRYDRLSQRWFIVMIDVPGCLGDQANRIMVAVSDGPTITPSTQFTFFHFQAPALQFADYPTLGIDAHALYIGTNNFSTVTSAFVQSNGYVVPKSAILGGTGGAISPTLLANLPVFTPQGVDDPYDADPAGYFVGVDAISSTKLDVIQVADPGGTPVPTTLPITVGTMNTPLLVPHLGNTKGNNGRLDGLDERLLEASMTADGHIWTSQGVAVNSTGGATSPDRDGSRWYEIGGLAGTPTVVQSGTVHDGAASNPLFYWMPTVAVSGQGIMAIAGSTAGAFAHVNAWYAARLPSAGPGTTDAPSIYTNNSTFAYNPAGDTGGTGGRRWGDYSLTRVDPLDNQTIWTIQEYVSATNTWGVKIARLRAPAPATPASASASLPIGTASVHVTLTGTSTAASGWYDPGAGFPQRLRVSVGCGVSVNAVTVVTPTSLDLDLNTVAASAGTCTVTTTNPDGQATHAAVLKVLGYRADGLIKLASAASYRGNNVYNSTGSNQTVTAKAKRRAHRTFSLMVQNDGTLADSFRLAGPGAQRGFVVHYFAGTTDVTSRVVNGTFVTAGLAPGGSTTLRLVVKVKRHARIGVIRSWLVRATSVHQSTKVDAVKATVRVVRG